MADFAPHTLTAPGSLYPYFASASSEFSGTFAAYKAFDGGVGAGQYWVANTSTGWLRLHVAPRLILNSYEVRVNSVPEATRAPKDWTMEGSNDGSSWTTLDTVTNQTAWGSGETRAFTCDVATTAYHYFRLNITANNGDGLVQVAELYLYADTPATDANQAPANMSGDSTPSPFVASDDGHFSTLAAWKAFDGNLSSECVLSGTSGWVKIDLGSGNSAIIQSYSIGQTSGEATRAPNAWVLEGSNDDTNWDTLDTVTAQSSWADNETRSFICDDVSTAYRYFRITISANNGDGSFTDLTELALWGAPGGGGGSGLLIHVGMDGGMRPQMKGGMNG
jgi:hypothetical protein